MSHHPKIVLITGSASSGKSEFAETLAARSSKSVIYVATAQVDETDREWQAKILKHQQRRPVNWQTVAATTELPTYVERANISQCLLIDSLGTWVANFIECDRTQWQQYSDRFLSGLQTTPANIIIVSEETGWGVVPAYASGRLFRDRLGTLSRQVGNIADITYLVAAGHVLNLSVLGEPLSKYKI